jgi:hypothetical protein
MRNTRPLKIGPRVDDEHSLEPTLLALATNLGHGQPGRMARPRAPFLRTNPSPKA